MIKSCQYYQKTRDDNCSLDWDDEKNCFCKSWAKLHNCTHIPNTAYAVQLKLEQIREKRRRRNRWKEEHYSTNPFFCALLNSLELYLWDGYLIGKKAEFEHFHNYFSKGYWDSSFKNSILGLDFQAHNVGRSGRLNPNWHDLWKQEKMLIFSAT